jgi:uncharacterized protein YegJ (DUF2314 family)
MSYAASAYQLIIYRFYIHALSGGLLGFLTSFSQGAFFYFRPNGSHLTMRKNRRFLILLLIPAFSLSCEKWAAQIPWLEKLPLLGKNAPSKSAEVPATFHIGQDDEELARIAQNARDTLPQFFRHLLRPANGESDFRLKYPFRADPGSGFGMEQLWLSDIEFKDGVYYGLVANTPFYIATMKKGDTVVFSTSEISDWVYIRDGKIEGGLSIKYLLEQIPEHERNEEQRAILTMFD